MSEAIRATVARILKSERVSYSTRYLGEKKGALGGTHPMDEWACVLTFEGRPQEPEEFEFFTGVGLRAEPDGAAKMLARSKFQGLMQADIDRRTHYGRRYLAYLETLRKPKAPDPADLLHSLIVDSSACEQSFESWCADFGYATDSRKALATYEAGQSNTDKLRRIIRPEAFRKLAEVLQEY